MSTLDRYNNIYDLPPYVLSDPESYDRQENSKIADPGPERQVQLIIRSAAKGDVQMTVSSHSQIDEFKQEIANSQGMDAKKMRFFYNGKELKNGSQLGLHKIQDESVIQLFY